MSKFGFLRFTAIGKVTEVGNEMDDLCLLNTD
jgi:hypothetical protein